MGCRVDTRILISFFDFIMHLQLGKGNIQEKVKSKLDLLQQYLNDSDLINIPFPQNSDLALRELSCVPFNSPLVAADIPALSLQSSRLRVLRNFSAPNR